MGKLSHERIKQFLWNKRGSGGGPVVWKNRYKPILGGGTNKTRNTLFLDAYRRQERAHLSESVWALSLGSIKAYTWAGEWRTNGGESPPPTVGEAIPQIKGTRRLLHSCNSFDGPRGFIWQFRWEGGPLIERNRK